MNGTFIRFIIVGVGNTIVGLSVMFALFHLFGLSYWEATFLGNAAGASVSYYFNRNFTFKSNANVPKSLIRFIIVILSCYFLSFYIGKQAVYWMLAPTEAFSTATLSDIAILFSTVLYTLLNYTLQKFLVFPQKKHIKTLA